MNQEELDGLRHTCAHVLAKAVRTLYPKARNAIGPSIDNGFYQDFDMGDVKLSDTDLVKIEKKMKEIVSKWTSFTFKEVSLEEAKELFKDNPYKIELAEEFAKGVKKLSTNDPGDFLDLCKMKHADNPSKEIKHFKLLSLAGAYWRGDEKNKMLTRIYGTCWPTKDELYKHLKMLEEAKKRDHRKIGKALDLFTFSPLVGPGLPLFTGKGTQLRRLIGEFVWEIMRPYGYERVWIPHLAKAELYKTSGHWDKFADDIFHVSSKKSDDAFVLKPMNCPHHTQIYASRPRSYRDLPIRMSEITTVYRDENTGQLQGLSRVRAITQDDAHIFCTMDQVKEEALGIYDIITTFYNAFDMPLRVRLSMHDPEDMEKYLGSPKVWDESVGTLRSLLDGLGTEYEEAVGEAAFYGPKIDFIASDAIGREWQLATIQLDFNQPERFGLEYVDSDGERKRPVMIHRAISGSIERFIAVLIEHYEGAFPFWLAPVQIRLATVGSDYVEAAKKIKSELFEAGMRVELDATDEKLGKKIRAAALQKIPWTIVIGEKEAGGGDFTVNVFGQEEDLKIGAKKLIERVKKESAFPIK